MKLICVFFLLFAQAASAQTFDWQGKALARVKINTVAFRGWIPSTGAPLRGTLILIPGRHGDGRGMADDAAWQQIGTDTGFAVMGCQFADGEPFPYQTDDSGEVAGAIDAAVTELSVQSKHPELAKAPLAFWGTSAGANVSAMYCILHPKRVAAFASSKGTFPPGGQMPAGKDEIPMLIAIGKADRPDWVKGSLENFEIGRKKNPPWTLALHPTEGHGPGGSLGLVRIFLVSAIKARCGAASSSSTAPQASTFSGFSTASGSMSASTGSSGLRKLRLQDGWLGDPATLEIAPYNTFRSSKAKATWLIDEATATAWKNYLQAGAK